MSELEKQIMFLGNDRLADVSGDKLTIPNTPPQECLGLDTLGHSQDLLLSFVWYRGAAAGALPGLGSIRLLIPVFHFNHSGWHGNGKCN